MLKVPSGRSIKIEEKRRNLLKRYLHSGTAKSDVVSQAFLRIPREDFLPEEQKAKAYQDTPLQIGYGQTISAPHISFIYAELLDVQEGHKILEVGAGSGYNAAFFAELAAPIGSDRPGHVYSIERRAELVKFARENLEKSHFSNRVTVIQGDGTLGHPPEAPYDRIIVTAAGPKVPEPLEEQLADQGKLIIPVGKQKMFQELILVERHGEKIVRKKKGGVAFVPLIGEHGF